MLGVLDGKVIILELDEHVFKRNLFPFLEISMATEAKVAISHYSEFELKL